MIDSWVGDIDYTPLQVFISRRLSSVVNSVEQYWTAIWWGLTPLDSDITPWNCCFSIGYSRSIWVVCNAYKMFSGQFEVLLLQLFNNMLLIYWSVTIILFYSYQNKKQKSAWICIYHNYF